MFFSRTHTLGTTRIPGEIPGSVLAKDPALFTAAVSFVSQRTFERKKRTNRPQARGPSRPRLAFTTSRAFSGTVDIRFLFLVSFHAYSFLLHMSKVSSRHFMV